MDPSSLLSMKSCRLRCSDWGDRETQENQGEKSGGPGRLRDSFYICIGIQQALTYSIGCSALLRPWQSDCYPHALAIVFYLAFYTFHYFMTDTTDLTISSKFADEAWHSLALHRLRAGRLLTDSLTRLHVT